MINLRPPRHCAIDFSLQRLFSSSAAAPAVALDCAALKQQTLGWEPRCRNLPMLPSLLPAKPSLSIAMLLFRMNDSTLRFEMRLPMEGWNNKLVFLLGGGFRGAMFPPTLPLFRWRIFGFRSDRYAAMATNGGGHYLQRR